VAGCAAGAGAGAVVGVGVGVGAGAEAAAGAAVPRLGLFASKKLMPLVIARSRSILPASPSSLTGMSRPLLGSVAETSK